MNLFIQFITNHGERLFFMAIVTAFGLGFIQVGMQAEGKILLIAVATLALNKARGSTIKKKEAPVEPKKESGQG